MSKATGPDTTLHAYIAFGLLAAAGGVLATPLGAGPAVLLALIATILMLVKGQGTLQKSGQQTLYARNVLLFTFGGWFFAELLSTAINSQQWTNLDYPMRFMLGMGVFWILRYAAIRRTEIFYYSIAVSALAAATIGAYQMFMLGIDRPMGWTNHPIYFGNLSVLLCIYAAIVLVTMRDRLTAQLRFLLIAAIPLLIFTAFLSMSRSSWLGLAGFVVFIDWRCVNRNRLIGGGAVIALSMVMAFMFVPELAARLRITDAVQDIQGIMNGDYRSSIGDRLQMWKAALIMFWSSPLIGVGSGHYQAEVVNLITSGAVDLELIQGSTIFNQPHSDIMDALASKGLVGLAAYLGLLIFPFRFFRKFSETTMAEVKTFALMGQATVIAFLMFGLANATLKIQIYCVVYPLTIAMFASLALNLSDLKGAQDANRQK